MSPPRKPETSMNSRAQPRNDKSQDSSAAQSSGPWATDERIFLLLLAFRILNAVSVRTFFQPDEYYQALEPAWYMAFGPSGRAWITWEWREHLRSSLHPVLFAITYYLANLLSGYIGLTPASHGELLLVAPKILQAGIAATGDYYTWKLGRTIYGDHSGSAVATLILTVVNPWQWFCSTRTFSNGLETTLTVAALCQWPFTLADPPRTPAITQSTNKRSNEESGTSNAPDMRYGRRKAALVLAAFATLLRPTNIILWAGLTLYAFLPSYENISSQSSEVKEFSIPRGDTARSFSWVWPSPNNVLVFVIDVVFYGSAALSISVASDYIFYQQLAFPPFNFLIFNVVMSLAIFYGNNDWHYYLSQGYPLLLTTALPFALLGMYRVAVGSDRFYKHSTESRKSLRGLLFISVLLPLTLSVLAHKEVRFIYPLLPILHVFAADPVALYFGPILTKRAAATGVESSHGYRRRIALAALLSLNVVIAYYTSQVHNSGLLPLNHYIRHEFEDHYMVDDVSSASLTKLKSMTVGFLMPCHSVPWRSHLQHPPELTKPGLNAWALTCEPPLHLNDQELKRKYRDEADLFYDDPRSWIRSNMARSMPQAAIDNQGTRPRREAGVYTATDASSGRNKKLWGKESDILQRDHKLDDGIDMADLLPYLMTQPASKVALHSNQIVVGDKIDEDFKQDQAHNISSSQTWSFGIEPKFDLDQARKTGTSPSSAKHIKRPWPHYLAFFEQLEPLLSSILRGSGYRECWRHFNSHWHDDWRRKGDVIVWCLRPIDN